MSDVNMLQEALGSAIGEFLRANNDSLQFDTTVTAEIVSVTNPAIGEYRVRYLNDSFLAYDASSDGEVRYRVGQNVYIQIPKSNYSDKKLIIGKKSTSSDELINDLRDIEKIDLLGVPILNIYDTDGYFAQDKKYGIYGAPEYYAYESEPFGATITDENNSSTAQKNLLFQSYAKDKKYLCFSAKFKTKWYEFWEAPFKGNYGIEVVFNTKNANENGNFTKTWRLDLNSKGAFYGNPYKYDDYIEVYRLIEFDANNLLGLKSINFFSEGIERAGSPSQEDLSQRYKNLYLDVPDEKLEDETKEEWQARLNKKYTSGAEIFVKDINIQFAGDRDFSGYTTNIITPNGIYFHNGEQRIADTLTLKAVLRYNGSTETVDANKAKYQWYVRDSRINISNADYNHALGPGWKILEAETAHTLIINAEDFEDKGILQKEYACVITYNDTNTAFDTCDIYYSINDIGKYYLKLVKSADGRTGSLTCFDSFTDATPAGDLTASWISIDVNDALTSYSTDDFILNDIDIANIYIKDTFYCSIIKNNEIIYTAIYDILDTIESKVFDIIWHVSDNGLFQYNEYGDYIGSLGKSISFEILRNGQQEAFDYSYTWSVDSAIDERLFTLETENGISDESVLKGDNKTEDNSLDFVISKRYYRKLSENNYINLTIEAEGGPYEFRYLLQFLKSGDPGTNGTSTSMVVNIIGENKAILQNGSADISLGIQVYHNGYASYNGKNLNEYYNFDITKARGYTDNPITNITPNSFSGYADDYTVNITTANYGYGLDGANTIIQIKATPKDDTFKYNIIYLMGIPAAKDVVSQAYEYEGPTRVMFNELGEEGQFDEIAPTIEGATARIYNGSDARLNDEGEFIAPHLFDPSTQTLILCNVDKSFIVPIVGVINIYSTDILNSWDGAGFTVNENGNYVMYASVVAGLKNSDNTFSGVMLGDLRSDTNEHGTGLIGFNHGQLAYGFYEDGYAFIGRPGAGRIEFNTDGNGIIQSSNYIKDSSGMMINLTDGAIDAYNFKLTSSALNIDSINNKFDFNIANISGDTGWFKIRNGNNNIIYLSGNSQYIQSSNYSNGSGLRINLSNGSLNSPNFSISSNGTATFSGTLNAAGGTFAGSLSGVDGTFSGTLSGVDGYIGGWKINSSGITSDSGNAFLYSDGSMEMGDFSVDTSGSIYAKDLTLIDPTGRTSYTGTIKLRNSTSNLIAGGGALSIASGAVGLNANTGNIFLFCGLTSSSSARSEIEMKPSYSSNSSINGTHNIRIKGGVLVEGNFYITGTHNITAVFG